MAYEQDSTAVTDALRDSNSTVFSDATISQILALATKDNATVRFDSGTPDAQGNVTVSSGAEVVFVMTSDTLVTNVKPPANAPVVIFQGRGGVIATINDAAATVPSGDQSQVDRIVVGSAGDDRIMVTDAKNTKVVLGSGNSTVTTGQGVDTVQAGLGNSTIVGGSGDYAVVKLAGNASNYTVTTNNGHAVVTDNTTSKTTDISRIQFVQLDNGNALVFAKDSVEGAIATLYHTAFGRDADAGGLDFWFDLGRAGVSLNQIASGFTNSAEFASTAAADNAAFINQLYMNTFGRLGESAGVSYWLDVLAHGYSRADLLVSFSQIAVQNILHTAPNQEATIIGSVNIVTGII